MDALTPGRTWQEKIKLTGAFTVTDTVLIDAYTWVDATEAYFVANNALNKDMFRNRHFNGVEGVDAEDSYITWEGGILDGNKANQTDAAQDPITNDPVCNLLFTRVPYLQVFHLRSHDSEGMGFKLTGRYSGGETTEVHSVFDVITWNNAKRGISIQNGLRNGIYSQLNSFNDSTDGGASQGAIFIGHSEGLYRDLMVEDSGANGIYINNVRNIQIDGAQVKGSSRHGMFVLGFVASAARGLRVARSSTGTANTYSDMYLSGQDYFPTVGNGYGTTKQAIFEGQWGEDISGQAQAKYAIEWEDAADNAGTFLTANESIFIKGIVNKGGGSSATISFPANARMGSIVMDVLDQSTARPSVPENRKTLYGGTPKYQLTSEQNNNVLKTWQGQVDVDTADGNHNKKLPGYATAGVGHTITIRKVTGDANTVTVLPQTGERIDGVVDATKTLSSNYQYVMMRCNGVDGWDTIAPGTGATGPAGPAGSLTGFAVTSDYSGALAAQLHACDATTGWTGSNLHASGALALDNTTYEEGTGSVSFGLKVTSATSKAYFDLGSSLDKSPYRYVTFRVYVDGISMSGPSSPWATPLSTEQCPVYAECASSSDLTGPHSSQRIPNMKFREWTTVTLRLVSNTQVRTIGFRSDGDASKQTDGYLFRVDNVQLRQYTPLEEAMEAGKSVLVPASYSPSQTQGVML